MIEGQVLVSDLVRRLEQMPDKFRARILQVVTNTVTRVEERAKEKLSGPVLHRRTGLLRSRVVQQITDEPNRILGIVSNNVAYAAAHEFGFDGTVNVREHLRRTKTKAQLYLKGNKAGQVNKAKTRKVQREKEPEITVRAHSMHMRLPERSFLRSSLAEERDRYLNDLRDAMKEPLQ